MSTSQRLGKAMLIVLFLSVVLVCAGSPQSTWGEDPQPELHSTAEVSDAGQLPLHQRNADEMVRKDQAQPNQGLAPAAAMVKQAHSKQRSGKWGKGDHEPKGDNPPLKSELRGSPDRAGQDAAEKAEIQKEAQAAAERETAVLKHQEKIAVATIIRMEFWMVVLVLSWLLFVGILAAYKYKTWRRGCNSLQEPLLHGDANDLEGGSDAVWLAAYYPPEEEPPLEVEERDQQAEALAAACAAAQEAKVEAENAVARATQAELDLDQTKFKTELERAAALTTTQMLSLTQQQIKASQQREEKLGKQLQQATLAEQHARKTAADARSKAAQTAAGLAKAQLSATIAQQEAEKAMARAAQAEASAKQEKDEAWTTARTLSMTKKQMKAAHENEDELKRQIEQALAAEQQARQVAAEEQATALAVAAASRAAAQQEADKAAARVAEAEAKLSMARTMSEQEPSSTLMVAKMNELKKEVQEAMAAEQWIREAEQSKTLTAAEQALAAALGEAEASSAIATEALENLAEFKARANQEKAEAQMTAKILSLTKKQLKAADEKETNLKQQVEHAMLAEQQARAAVKVARLQSMPATSGSLLTQAAAPNAVNGALVRTSSNWVQHAVGQVRMTTPMAEKSLAGGSMVMPCFRNNSVQMPAVPRVMGA